MFCTVKCSRTELPPPPQSVPSEMRVFTRGRAMRDGAANTISNQYVPRPHTQIHELSLTVYHCVSMRPCMRRYSTLQSPRGLNVHSPPQAKQGATVHLPLSSQPAASASDFGIAFGTRSSQSDAQCAMPPAAQAPLVGGCPRVTCARGHAPELCACLVVSLTRSLMHVQY